MERKQIKKQTVYLCITLLVLLAGLLALRLWYDSKCIKFQDKNMEIQTLYLLDTGKGSVLKEEADKVRSFYVTDTSGRFETLEDLKLFPNLEELHLTYDTGVMTDEEKEEFQKQRVGIINMLEETLPDLKKLKKLDLTYFDYFEDLDFLSECSQIEELDINYNTIRNIQGLSNMKNLRILNLAYNPFTDISPLCELKNLEAVNLYQVSVDNLEVLAEIPLLKLVVYEPKNKKQEEILRKLEDSGVMVHREYKKGFEYLIREMEEER